MEPLLKTNRVHLVGLVVLAGLATACAPSHQGQSRYGAEVLTHNSQPVLRPSCNTYVQPCGVATGTYLGNYYAEQFVYAPPIVAQPQPEPTVVLMPEPVDTTPIYIDPPAPISEPMLPTYTPSEPYWPEVDAPAPTWTPLRK